MNLFSSGVAYSLLLTLIGQPILKAIGMTGAFLQSTAIIIYFSIFLGPS
jgi:hypothetical protein